MAKVKKVMLDSKTVSTTEMLSSLDNTSFACSSKDILKDVFEGVLPIVDNRCYVGDDVYHDVEFFQSFSTKGSSTIFDVVSSSCKLDGAKEMLRLLLDTPTWNTSMLQKRQAVLQKLMDTPYEQPQHDLLSLETDTLWLFQEEDQNLKDLYDMVFFRFCMLKPLNKSSTALSCYNIYRIIGSPVIGLLSPILYFVIPYLIISYKFKIKVSFKVYLKIMMETMMSGDMFAGKGSSYKYLRVISYVFSVIFWFQGIFNSFEISKTIYKISKHIVSKMNNVAQFLKIAHERVKQSWTDDMQTTFFSNIEDLVSSDVEETYVNSLTVVPFKLTSNFGEQLHSFLVVDKSIIRSLLIKYYMIEGLQACTHFKETFQSSFVKYVDSKKPVLNVQQIGHPCIDIAKIIRNDIHVGGGNNAIITGPNAGGKSTFVKSVLINVILAQTIGITNGFNCEMTPFYAISSQINVPDSKGYESLFEAEMYRCKAKLDMLKTFAPDQFSFFVMDEIFNSTNPVEGISGAYAIAKKMSEYDSCVLMFTTHYVYLTKLKHTNRFTNYRMNVIKDDVSITYPYQLEKGISKQYIALDLLRKNGFDDDIIEEAVSLRNKLVASPGNNQVASPRV